MAQQLINTISENDTKFTGCLLIKSVSYGMARNGKPFTNIIFMDPSGTIPAKLWNTGKEGFQHESGEILELSAAIEFYQNEPQIILNEYHPLTADDPRNTISYYLQNAPMSFSKMKKIINTTIENIENPLYREIAETFINKEVNGNTFYEQPAAKTIHHAHYRGLMYHTVRMLQQAQALLSVYDRLDINKDLLMTGILIHDLGKLEELSGFMDTEYTPEGTMLSHIGILDGWLVEHIILNGYDLQSEEVVLLRHMVLSHHGKREYGSPTEPVIPEAELLHRIDDTDARMTMFEDELLNTSEGEMTKRIWGLNNRMLYKAK